MTTSPPGSIHFVGAAVKRATGVALACRPARSARRQPTAARGYRRDPGSTSGERAARPARRPPRRCDLMRVGRDRRGGARARPTRNRPHDRERLRLRRLRGPRVPAGAALPDHARWELLREARPAGVPASAARLGRRRRRALRRRLPQLGSGVGRVARPRRPAGADPLCAPRRVAPPAARLRGATPLDPERGRKRQGSAVGKGLRVPRRRQADSRRRPTGRCCCRAHSRDGRRESSSRPTTWRESVERSACSSRSSSTAACRRSSCPPKTASACPAAAAAEETAGLLREIV